jgi:hypothetical protein
VPFKLREASLKLECKIYFLMGDRKKIAAKWERVAGKRGF